MSVGPLKSQLAALTAHGRKLTGDDVKRLVATAKAQSHGLASALPTLQRLSADAFAPGAREQLQTLIGGMQAEAFIDVTTPTQRELGAATPTGAPGVTLRFADGLGALTQNSFWLEGTAHRAGPVEVDVDGRKLVVTARPHEPAASIAARLVKLLPPGYAANINAGFPDGRAAVQIFHKDALPAALLQPVLDGRQPPVKVLITGYGKFGPYATDAANPAWQMAQKLAQQKFPGAQVQAVLLPVEWSKVDDFARSLKQTYDPDVVISLGAGPHGLEVWAQNKTEGEDAAGVARQGEPATPGGPEFEASTLPVDAIEAAERRAEDPARGGGLSLHAPAEGARDARWQAAKQFQIDANNTYLCNYLNYRMLESTRGTGVMTGFVHVDQTTSPEELAVVVEQSVKAQLEKRAANPPGTA